MTLRVPQDLTLNAALEQADDGDVIEITEEVAATGQRVAAGVTLRGASPDSALVADGPWALELAGRARVERLRVDNPSGGGLRMSAGASAEGVELRVGGVAVALIGGAPHVEGLTVLDSAVGVEVSGDCAPHLSALNVAARTVGLRFQDSAGGALVQVSLAVTQGPGVHITDRAAPQLVGVAVMSAGQAGFRVADEAAPSLVSCRVLSSPDDALLIEDTAEVQLDGFTATGRHRGVRVAGSAQVSGEELEVRGSRGPGLEIGERASVKLTRGRLTDSADAGVVVKGEATLIASDLRLQRNLLGLRLDGEAQATLQGCVLAENRQGEYATASATSLRVDGALVERSV